MANNYYKMNQYSGTHTTGTVIIVHLYFSWVSSSSSSREHYIHEGYNFDGSNQKVVRPTCTVFVIFFVCLKNWQVPTTSDESRTYLDEFQETA